MSVERIWDECLAGVKRLRDGGTIASRCHVILRKRGEEGGWAVESLHTRACCETTVRVANKKSSDGCYVAHVDADGRMCCFLGR